jgi:hypothetical protein
VRSFFIHLSAGSLARRKLDRHDKQVPHPQKKYEKVAFVSESINVKKQQAPDSRFQIVG